MARSRCPTGTGSERQASSTPPTSICAQRRPDWSLSAGKGETVIGPARVSWFSLDKKFGFVSLGGTAADAFLHLSVLKSAGYVSVPAGTSMQVRVETDRGRQRVVEVSNVDTSTAVAGEPAPILKKR